MILEIRDTHVILVCRDKFIGNMLKNVPLRCCFYPFIQFVQIILQLQIILYLNGSSPSGLSSGDLQIKKKYTNTNTKNIYDSE